MKKGQFCDCMAVLRSFADWDRGLYALGVDIDESPVGGMADCIINLMRDYDLDWSYDKKLGIDWIIEWAYTSDSPDFEQTRHGRTWQLDEAGILYDFLVFMNEHGWEDE